MKHFWKDENGVDQKGLLYYPENLRKAESRNCSLKLDMLFSCIAAMKNICILSFIIFVSFRDVGLISMAFYNRDTSTTTNAVMYFQFQGLTNTLQGIATNSLLDTGLFSNDNSLEETSTPTTNPDTDSVKYEDAVLGFENATYALRYLICLILVINLLLFLPYIWFVILRYSSFGFCKFSLIFVTFIQWLIFTILLTLYYYEFHAFFHNYAQLTLEYELKQLTGDTFDVVWFPDWGIIIALILWFYLLRLIYAAFKAM